MADKLKKLTAREQRFVEEYCIDCNATQAAIRAGYSKKGAKVQGHRLLTNANLRPHIDARLKELSLAAAEVTKLTADIAQGNLADYFTVTEVEETPRIRKPLGEVIDSIQAEIEFEEEYAQRAGYSEEEMKTHDAAQARRRRQIIRHQLELERDPRATGFVQGPPQKVKRAELDMVRLVEDKERGIIKSVKPGEFGLSVEMYARDAALDKLAKMHGLYEKDNEQSKATAVIQTEVKIIPSTKKIATDEKDVEL
ncbi:terminase small subunit [Pontibacter mangrovi]|uniref:Terminase small subunit n=1 Tax=Pontibacter mangrovi TaxID=2589816 RepID=A0A501WDI3_9BACT|nr:terminase small subunit [Pontibacter mangrovi]TPE44947.1 terminase small subunit [Pontibacter mangrovi]